MHKKLVLSIWVLFIGCSAFAQTLKSPDAFLGYPLGSKYTPHYKIVEYFQYAATVQSKAMQLMQYGTTNEGRPLLLAFITAPENLQKLEDIRKNNLRLTGMLNDKPGDVRAPSIVWLSYNVHGNEASSSEVALKVLFQLLDPSNAAAKKYLQNVVVIIDPCLNPDGRDRYVHWITQMRGANVNPALVAREHNEPWPGGRTNHYNFDLNRDWSWQTQIETQQRMVQYNQWMPQIHSDYHEQMINNPYYFAPAAQPYHEAITPFQRSFQTAIGKNNARYFDANGWLYFTREFFDLFYPAYGDTYPSYNGSVGMTFEQAGHSQSSSAVITNEGDTLTLLDRIEHHFTTTMSTIEMASKSNDQVMNAFKQFFDNARNGNAALYKSYVIANTNSNKMTALKKLLDANGIEYGISTLNNAKGFNYFTGKEESFNATGAIVVQTAQPKGILANVLFEPKSKLVDSATYDITAWSLPYAFGLQTYASKEKVASVRYAEKPARVQLPNTSYGYLIPYQSFEDARFLAAIVQSGMKVRYAERDFSVDGKSYKAGTIIVLKKSNENKLNTLLEAAQQYAVTIDPVSTGFMETGFDFGSEKVKLIHAPRVAMLTGNNISPESAGEVWHYFDQYLQYPITLINQEDFAASNLKNFDVLILPNGRYKFLGDKETGADLKNWVRSGGKIIALESVVAQMAANDWGIKLKKIEEDKKEDSISTPYADLKKYAGSEQEGLKNFIAGALFNIEMDETHPLSFGIGKNYYSLKQDDNLFEFLKEGWNVGVVKKDNLLAGFVGSKLKERIKDALIFGTQPMGKGIIIYLGDNPLFRNFWENGKLLFSNAVFLCK